MAMRIRGTGAQAGAGGNAAQAEAATLAPQTAPIDDAAALPRIPAGLNALFREVTEGEGGKRTVYNRPLADDEMVRVVNLSISSFTLTDRNLAVKTDKGYGEKRQKLKAFAYYDVMTLYARRALAAQNQYNGNTRPIIRLIVAPPEGDCGGKMSFTQADFHGTVHRFGSCPYRNCPRHPAPVLAGDNGEIVDPQWSVTQMQHFIAACENKDPIDFVTESIDRRHDVVAYGQFRKRLRDDRAAADMGVTPRKPGSRPN